MRIEPTQEELFAFEIARSVLGVEVDSSGETREVGHVDAILSYANGHQAAMEVTILCDRETIQLWKRLEQNDFRWMVDGSALWWRVSIGPKVRVNEMIKHLPELIRLHEQYQIRRPNLHFPFDVIEESSALQWFEQQDMRIWGYSNISDDPNALERHPGAVSVMPTGNGGAVNDNADIVPLWLSEQAVSDPQIRSKLAKLAASGFDEQHLFLVVDLSVTSFSFMHAVAATGAVPANPPALADVTHLWLVPTHMFHNTYLTWNVSSGWKRRTLPGPSDASKESGFE